MWWSMIPWKTVAKVAAVLVPAIVVFGLGCRTGAGRQAKADAKTINSLSDQVVELELETSTLRARIETRDEVLGTVRESILQAGRDRDRFLDALEDWRSQPARVIERIERVPVEVTSEDCEEAVGEFLAIVGHLADLEREP